METNSTWDIVATRMTEWYQAFISGLPNFAAAILVLLFFAFVARIAKQLTTKATRRSLRNEALAGLLAAVVRLLILAIGLFFALGVLNLDKTVTSLLAGAGVMGLALGFALQDIASNFISGIFIAFREPYKIGDIIEVEGIFGKVKSIDLRTSLIETFDGIDVYVPNQYMFTKPLKNFSGIPVRRLGFQVGVSYAENLRQVEKLIRQAIEPIEGRIPDREVEVFFKEFGDSSIICDIRVWIHYPANLNYFRFRHQAIMAIKETFDKNGITIPFPIRTLDFGIKGGVRLNEQLVATNSPPRQ